jgi:hypothetical protein
VVILVENKILSEDVKGWVSYHGQVVERRVLVIVSPAPAARGQAGKKGGVKCHVWADGP